MLSYAGPLHFSSYLRLALKPVLLQTDCMLHILRSHEDPICMGFNVKTKHHVKFGIGGPLGNENDL